MSVKGSHASTQSTAHNQHVYVFRVLDFFLSHENFLLGKSILEG
jgi:hypothetical protein